MFIVPPPEAKCGGSLDITKVDLGLFVTVFVIFRISLNILYKNVHFFDKNNKTEICWCTNSSKLGIYEFCTINYKKQQRKPPATAYIINSKANAAIMLVLPNEFILKYIFSGYLVVEILKIGVVASSINFENNWMANQLIM